MAKVRVHVWHDANGQILAIGHPVAVEGHTLKVVPIAGDQGSVLETEVEVNEEMLKTLHQTHKVDIKNKSLIKAK